MMLAELNHERVGHSVGVNGRNKERLVAGKGGRTEFSSPQYPGGDGGAPQHCKYEKKAFWRRWTALFADSYTLRTKHVYSNETLHTTR